MTSALTDSLSIYANWYCIPLFAGLCDELAELTMTKKNCRLSLGMEFYMGIGYMAAYHTYTCLIIRREWVMTLGSLTFILRLCMCSEVTDSFSINFIFKLHLLNR